MSTEDVEQLIDETIHEEGWLDPEALPAAASVRVKTNGRD